MTGLRRRWSARRRSLLRGALPVVALVAALTAAIPAQALYANKDFFWKPASGKPVTIPVCWENSGAAPAARRGWARDAIDASWQRYARVNFVEWDTCTTGEKGVRIDIRPGQSAFPGGVNLDGKASGGGLDLSYSGGPAGCQGSSATLEHCIRAVTAHEFGHVLGFYHEEERDDYVEPRGTPPKAPCSKQTFANSNKQLYGAYDVDSVMSYCGQPASDPATWKEDLSPGDVAAVQRAYGRRIPGSLVSPGGNCVASHLKSKKPVPVFLWDCDEAADDQEWSFDRGKGTLRLGASRCLQVTKAAPAAVLGWCAEESPGQHFTLADVRVRGWGGLCLDLHGGVQANGTPVQMWQCGALGGANQRWTITAKGEIRYRSSSRCLTVPAQGDAFLHGCVRPAEQHFSFPTGGQLRLVSTTNTCLDIRAWTDAQYLSGLGLPVNGLRLQRFTCLPQQLNQRWNVTARIRHVLTGRCLVRETSSEANGARITTQTCTGLPAEKWDYYWR